MTKRKTRRQKIEANKDKPSGQSKYAKKIRARTLAARKLGLPSDSTWPVIWEAQKTQ